jgi:hypothetical protein
MNNSSPEPELPPQGLGVPQPSAALEIVGMRKRQRAGAFQNAPAPIPDCLWSWVLKCGRMFVGTLREFWLTLIAWLAPTPRWRRYRVAPRANAAAFRHDLIRSIQLELRRAGLVSSPPVPDYTAH